MSSGIPLVIEQGPNLASGVDSLYFFITAVTAFFALLVVIFVIVFATKNRDRTGERVGESFRGSIPLEIGWSIVPLFVTMAIFVWATAMFFDMV
jgi:cytochrome c oxidase subunit 2